MNKEFVKLRLSDIRPYPNNPRINDNAVKYVVQSIKDCENLDPIEVDEDNIILSGHTRLKALEQLGYDETECVRYTGLSEDQKKKYRILANKTGEFAEWDLDILSEELDSLLDFDAEFYGFGFETEDIEPIDLEKGGDDTNGEGQGVVCHCPKCGFVFEVKA